MPDRVIRDEIAKSDRWLGCRRNTHRLAFILCILAADDLGNFEATDGALWRMWHDACALTDRNQVGEILAALTDADLIRLYVVEGKRYGHIPKFRQRLRYVNGKHPRPPAAMECPEIKDNLEEKTGRSQTKTDGGPPIVGEESGCGPSAAVRSEVKRSEVKRSEESDRGPPMPSNVKTILIKMGTATPTAKTMTREEQLAFVAARAKEKP